MIADTKVTSLRRFQEEVREVQVGTECGFTLEGVKDFQEGDLVEFYRRKRER